MNNIKYIILSIIGVMLIASSCSDDGVEIERTLEIELAGGKITMDNSAQSKEIPVVVDQGEIIIANWDGEAWGRVEVKGDGAIEITVESNTTFYDRTASVVVGLKSGWRNKVIKITQYGSDSELSILPESVDFDFMGGELEVDVKTLTDSWTATTNVDWLQIIPHVKSGKILIRVGRNEAETHEQMLARSTIITINSGKSSKDLMVTQEAGLYFALPYENFNNWTNEAIIEFEKKRYSSFTKGYVLVATKSPLFHLIKYYNNPPTSIGSEAILGPKYGHEYFETDEFMALMVENGYEYLGIEGITHYFWKEFPGRNNHVLAQVSEAKPKIITLFSRTEKPETDPDAPTFDVVPYPDPALAWHILKPAVRDWEAANGGTLDAEVETQLTFSVKGSDLYAMRYYLFNTIIKGADLITILNLYWGAERAFTKKFGAYVLNPLFHTLLEKSGAKFYTIDKGDYIYINESKNLIFAISRVWFAEAPDVVYAAINFSKLDKDIPVAPQAITAPYTFGLHRAELSQSMELGKPMVLKR